MVVPVWRVNDKRPSGLLTVWASAHAKVAERRRKRDVLISMGVM